MSASPKVPRSARIQFLCASVIAALASAAALPTAAAWGAQPASDQQDAPSAPAEAASTTKQKPVTLEAVKVVARQRTELSQDVPITITSFTPAEIQNARIRTPSDFVLMTPGVSEVQSQNAGTDFLTIRGITQVRNGAPPVATVVDGVQQVSPLQFNQQLYSINNVEVLQGPQGALYGRNAIGGAILITTDEPTTVQKSMVRVGVGNGRQRDVFAQVSGPLNKDASVRYLVSGIDTFFGGLINNTFLHKPVDYERNVGVHTRLMADVNDNLSLDFQLNSSRTIGGALPYVYQPAFGIEDASDTSVPITAYDQGYDKRKMNHASGVMKYRTSLGTFSIVAAYDNINEVYNGDSPPYLATIEDGTQGQYFQTNAKQVDARFTSDSDHRFRWIAGASFLRTADVLSTWNGENLGLGIPIVKEKPLGPDSIAPTTVFFADRTYTNNPSVYWQLAYDITPQLEADVAWRYDVFRISQTNVTPAEFSDTPGEVRHAKFLKGQPKVTLTYKPLQQLTVYGSWGVGFRQGGFNQNGEGELAEQVGVNGVPDLYQPEEAKTAEFGFKSSLFDGRLHLDGSYYKTRDRNALYFVFVGALSAQVLTNINRVNIRGFDLSAKALVTRDLMVYGNYGYTHSRVARFQLNESDDGNVAPYTPRYTASAGVQYTPFIESINKKAMLRLDYSIIGPQYWDPDNSTPRSPVKLLNLNLGISPTDDRWSANIWAKNLNNHKYLAEYVLGGFAQMAEPRTFGVSFTYRFQQ